MPSPVPYTYKDGTLCCNPIRTHPSEYLPASAAMHSFTVLAAFCAIVPGLAFPQYARSNTKTDPEACFPLPRAPVRAPLISTNFNYTGARIDGKNGTEKGGVPVPLPGDKDHEFQHPAPGAYRGPWYENLPLPPHDLFD